MNTKAKMKRKVATKTTKESVPRKLYNYDTPIGVLAKDYGFTPDVPSDTKIGDFFKARGYPVAARILKMMK